MAALEATEAPPLGSVQLRVRTALGEMTVKAAGTTDVARAVEVAAALAGAARAALPRISLEKFFMMAYQLKAFGCVSALGAYFRLLKAYLSASVNLSPPSSQN